MKKRWAPRPAPFLHLKEADNPFHLPESVNLLLARRGYTGEELNNFLNPSMDRLSPWSSIGGAEGAADRISSAIQKGEKILVHGDFDADGITATALVYSAVDSLGGDIDYFIPDRFQDGYGLGPSSIEACREKKVHLLITVDCGVSASAQVGQLKDMGIDVVVTDHHQPGSELPPADHIVDPSLDGDVPWSQLAGAGVAWMVMRGVFRLMDGDDDHLQRLLQLVAAGTVSDVVSLKDDNRILVSLGLDEMRKRPFPGIAALADSASRDIRKLGSEDLAFYMGPRLNACGRIGHARDAVALLLAEDFQMAKGLMGVVERYNRRRRQLDRDVLNSAMVSADEYSDSGCLVLAGEGWHRGVIGIAASRLVSRFGVPSVMVALEEGIGYGSARSVPGIPIYSILR
ncbi:MAG: single-stranded-DNA-specific exonuclease RecJ, partial [Candidatus Aegiribacteria sp.]|nr:single-stranded-DNA-specific exonuclease RecJ [Candidatus Aegiribacteria sp.]MBD3294693.1 single-stranded-DNA-specific exonuclease RecJ [Candidatus Fermentibacteria bacterium]